MGFFYPSNNVYMGGKIQNIDRKYEKGKNIMYESPLLSPTTDFIFKRIFGNEEGKVGLISLLNAILNGDPVVKDLKFLNTEPPKDELYTKASRLDVEVTTDNDTVVNVEMQCVDTGDLDSRSITYASKLVGQYTEQSAIYDDPKVISIWIVKDKLTHGTIAKRLHPIEDAVMYYRPTTLNGEYKELFDKMRVIFVQLSKFKEKRIAEEVSKIMQEWAQFFIDKPENVHSNDKGMEKAKYIWNKVSGDKVVKDQIKAIEKYEMDKRSELTIAMREGEKKGIEKGLKEGEKKGREKGLKEGEKKKEKELALNMKSKGFTNDMIADCLNISIDELNILLGI